MSELRFQAIVGPEGVIRPPIGSVLPEGRVDVIVRPDVTRPPHQSTALSETRRWLLEAAEEAEATAISMPSDLAENHDHYAHGKPRP